MKEEVDWKKKKKMDAESYAAVCVGVRIPMGDHREGSRGSKMRLRQGKKKRQQKKIRRGHIGLGGGYLRHFASLISLYYWGCVRAGTGGRVRLLAANA